LALKQREGALVVVTDIVLPEAKTKRMVEFLSRLELRDNVLIVLHEENEGIKKAARNLPYVKVLRSEGLNVYDLLRYHQILFTQEALRRISERLEA
jgi:large subunit ribosomal protein L4